MKSQMQKELIQKPDSKSINIESLPKKDSTKKPKNIAAIFCLSALLAGGGLFLLNNTEAPSQSVKKESVLKIQKAEFVKNFLLLSESEFEDRPNLQKHSDNIHNDPIKFQVAPSVEETRHVNRDISNAHPEKAESDFTYSEEDELRNAQASEALSISYSEEVESAHQDERDEHLQRLAENEAKYKAAMDDVNLLKANQNKDHPHVAHHTPNRLMMKKAYMMPENPEFGLFKGAITKCYIRGHDMHWINPSGWILKHVEKDEAVTGNVLVAREVISSSDKGVVVTVYENGYEIYDHNGTLISSGNRK